MPRLDGFNLTVLLISLSLLTGCGGCSESEKLTVPAEKPEAAVEAEPRDDFVDSRSSAVDTGDLPEIRERGTLRVLVDATEDSFLSARGRGLSSDRELIRQFARGAGLQVQFVLVDRFEQLFPALLEGRGDLIAADLTVTKERAKEVAFTRPTAVSEEVLVGRTNDESPPTELGELAGREIHVRAGSSYETTLRALVEAWEGEGGAPTLVTADRDPEQLVHDVAVGRRPYTIVDSHLLDAINTYEDRVTRRFPVASGRQIAWAVRKDNPELKAALDAFIVATSLTGHTRERFTGDLDGIRERGVLRVLTRNNPVTYFLHRGNRMGFDYQLAKMLADELGLRLEMVVVRSRDQLIPHLLEGRGDLIAASLSVTPERSRSIAFSRPYLTVEEWVVQRAAEPLLSGPEALKGKRIHVRRSSSYHESLLALQKPYGPFEIVEAPEDLETEVLVEQLAEGEIDLTVADSHILQVEQTYRNDIVGAFALPAVDTVADAPVGTSAAADVVVAAAGDEASVKTAKAKGAVGENGEGAAIQSKDIAFGVRPDSTELLAIVDDFVKRTYRGLEYNMARKRYFENSRTIRRAKTESVSATGQLSPYDDIIRNYSKKYGLDWRLAAAVAFQESRFDPKAESWVGAKGLFQVMPTTGKSLGFENLEDPREGAHAGIRYIDWLLHQLDGELEFKQRLRFALASYNVGLGHVRDARRLAAELGLDPDRWFGNVEEAMLLLQQPKYYKRARHGYCRGSEPVKYVSEIQSHYDQWVNVLPE